MYFDVESFWFLYTFGQLVSLLVNE